MAATCSTIAAAAHFGRGALRLVEVGMRRPISRLTLAEDYDAYRDDLDSEGYQLSIGPGPGAGLALNGIF